ncbi:CoA transferase [Pseudomonadales bacterium]|jgi:crotonobetainyl-CoA:carnitine CoA-transferase CaiB-like acyl-CoA transferase|nr:CoA transferase [Pseudomonadales bacterium]
MSFLSGTTVVTIEQAVAAPACSMRLAQAGAKVIKVERPEGDFARGYDSAIAGQSSYFVWLNAGKKSVVLDLARPEHVSSLRKLINDCDVLIQNLKPGALQKLGLDLEQLHQELPSLISMSISGFAPDGPGHERKAYDLLMQAESGLSAISGSPHAPGRVGVSVVDIATGQFAYEAILGALIKRGNNGPGSRLNVSLFDAVAQWLAVPYLLDRYGPGAPERVGLAHPGICPYGVFTARCGQSFILSIQNQREWQRLCEEGIQQPDLFKDQRCRDNETRVSNRDFVDRQVQLGVSAMDYAQLSERFTQADLAFAPVNSMAHLKSHPDFHTYTVKVGDELIELPRIPGLSSDADLTAKVPTLGEHTDEVLASLT